MTTIRGDINHGPSREKLDRVQLQISFGGSFQVDFFVGSDKKIVVVTLKKMKKDDSSEARGDARILEGYVDDETQRPCRIQYCTDTRTGSIEYLD